MTAWAELWPDFAIQRIPCAERASAHGLIARNNHCCAKEQQQFSIFRLHNPAEAKKRGKNLTLRPDWDKVKISLMYEICMCKFMQNPKLRDALLATGNSLLVEGNTWGDYFWGKVKRPRGKPVRAYPDGRA